MATKKKMTTPTKTKSTDEGYVAPPGATNANRLSGAYSDKGMSTKQYFDSLYKQPPTPKPQPIKISTTPKPLSAKDAQANAKAIAKFNRGEARTAARLKEQLAPGRARAARANAGKPQPPQPRGGSGASRSFGGNMGGRGNMGGGLRKQGK